MSRYIPRRPGGVCLDGAPLAKRLSSWFFIFFSLLNLPRRMLNNDCLLISIELTPPYSGGLSRKNDTELDSFLGYRHSESLKHLVLPKTTLDRNNFILSPLHFNATSNPRERIQLPLPHITLPSVTPSKLRPRTTNPHPAPPTPQSPIAADTADNPTGFYPHPRDQSRHIDEPRRHTPDNAEQPPAPRSTTRGIEPPALPRLCPPQKCAEPKRRYAPAGIYRPLHSIPQPPVINWPWS